MIPILGYHAIGHEASPLWTPPERLEAQLSALERSGYRGVTLSEAFVAMNNESDERLVAITFDDAYSSVASSALPRLKALGFKATVFVISDYCGKPNLWPGQPPGVPRENLLTWSELSALAEEGWEIGAHTATHRVLRNVTPDILDAEIRGCRQSIEANLGRPCEAFAYPYGAYDAASMATVRSTFHTAVGTSLGIASRRSDVHALPRIDSYYITPALIESLHTRRSRLYLEGRQAMRTARRIFRKDWV